MSKLNFTEQCIWVNEESQFYCAGSLPACHLFPLGSSSQPLGGRPRPHQAKQIAEGSRWHWGHVAAGSTQATSKGFSARTLGPSKEFSPTPGGASATLGRSCSSPPSLAPVMKVPPCCGWRWSKAHFSPTKPPSPSRDNIPLSSPCAQFINRTVLVDFTWLPLLSS